MKMYLKQKHGFVSNNHFTRICTTHFTQDLSLYAYKVQLALELKSNDHRKYPAFVEWTEKLIAVDEDKVTKLGLVLNDHISKK